MDYASEAVDALLELKRVAVPRVTDNEIGKDEFERCVSCFLASFGENSFQSRHVDFSLREAKVQRFI